MKGKRKELLTYAFLLIGIIALLISIILPSLERSRMTGGRVPCASRLRQIGQALLLYSQDHAGTYPQSLDQLLEPEGLLSRECLTCAVSDQKSLFLTPGALANGLGEDDVIAYEPLVAHDNQGSNVLYGDGHVSWLTPEELNFALARSATRPTRRGSTTALATAPSAP